jgi:RNA-directed DNA polymerase
MTTQLTRVAEKAKTNLKLRFTSLAHLLTPQFLAETWRMLNKKGAPGVDGETIEQYERNLEERVTDLHARLRGKCYQAPPVRRVEIPKGDGTGRVRLLGIPTVEDRLLQAAVARILNAVYDPLFLECSYGYRPKRSAHDAVRQLRQHLVVHNVMQIYEADIRAYFDRVNHDWLRRMLRQRITDPVLLRLIDKWLRAGVMDHGLKRQTESGVPQGGPISCVLSNGYLHYVLDLWFEKRMKPTCRGAAYLVRFVDDFVGCFQYKEDADRFGTQLRERFSKFHIELAEEKTLASCSGDSPRHGWRGRAGSRRRSSSSDSATSVGRTARGTSPSFGCRARKAAGGSSTTSRDGSRSTVTGKCATSGSN